MMKVHKSKKEEEKKKGGGEDGYAWLGSCRSHPCDVVHTYFDHLFILNKLETDQHTQSKVLIDYQVKVIDRASKRSENHDQKRKRKRKCP